MSIKRQFVLLDIYISTFTYRMSAGTGDKAGRFQELLTYLRPNWMGEVSTFSEFLEIGYTWDIRVGPWSVKMFRLGRPDVLPQTDLGIRKGVMRTYRHKEMPPPEEVIRIAEPWRPYLTPASSYLWRSLELGDDALILQGG